MGKICWNGGIFEEESMREDSSPTWGRRKWPYFAGGSRRSEESLVRKQCEEEGEEEREEKKEIKWENTMDSQGLVLSSQLKSYLKGLFCKTNFGIGLLLKVTL